MNRSLLISIGFGLMAGIAHYLYVRNLDASATGGARVKVAVTVNDVRTGQKLFQPDIAVREVPSAFVDERFVPTSRADDIVGVPLSVDVAAGEIIHWTDFDQRPERGPADLAKYVEAGQRAMTIPVNASLSLGGLLRPGHRVDIIGTFPDGRNGSGERQSLILLQNITVLAVGDALDEPEPDRGRFNTVTLSVTIEQGELLSFSSDLASLSLVLRGHQDLTTVSGLVPVRMENLFSPSPETGRPSRVTGGAIERLEADR